MKVVTRMVEIEGQKFVLIKDKNDLYNSPTKEYYGTIPYDELNEEGRMKRALNGFEMCIESTIAGAIQDRTNRILIDRFLKANPQIDLPNNKGIKEYCEFMNTLNFNYN